SVRISRCLAPNSFWSAWYCSLTDGSFFPSLSLGVSSPRDAGNASNRTSSQQLTHFIGCPPRNGVAGVPPAPRSGCATGVKMGRSYPAGLSGSSEKRVPLRRQHDLLGQQ